MLRKPKTGRCWNCLLGNTGANADLRQEDRLRFTREIVADPGETFRVGNAGHSVLVISEGVIKSERGIADGRVAVTGFHYPGDLVEVPAPIARETAFEAVTVSRACEVDLATAKDLVPDREAMLDCISDHAMSRICADEGRILGLAHASAAERVIAFLNLLALRPGAHNGNPRVVWTPMRRDDIANYLGMQPETLSRTYAELVRTGAIAVRGRNEVELLKGP